MAELLFLAHRIPFPPDKGDKIRSWNVLRFLASRYKVHLGCFIDDAADWQHVGALKAVCSEMKIVPLPRFRSRLRSLAGLLNGEPLSVRFYRHQAMRDWVRDLHARRQLDAVYAYSGAMAQYADLVATRSIVDFVDVDSEKWRAYAQRKPWPESLIYAREADTLLAFERKTAAKRDLSLFVSAAEAALFRQRAPEVAATTRYLNNGVDCDFFSPGRVYQNPFPENGSPIVFTGAMDYWANVDAVVWFADKVLPRIREQAPAATFWIVGVRPAKEVQRLVDRGGIVVTGRVPDIRPYLAHAAAIVAPLRIARGIQNKVLEGMAMARPVIATPEAAEGIEAHPTRELLIARDAEEFARSTFVVLSSGAHSIGQAARHAVLTKYDWSACLAPLRQMLDLSESAEILQQAAL